MSRILIVEDNARNLKLVRDVLQVKGHSTLEAGTAEEGLAIARAEHPDLILMDIQLPGMNGIEAFRRLRAEEATRSIPVVAISASVMQDARREITDAGFDGFVEKPIKLQDFLQSVARALERGE